MLRSLIAILLLTALCLPIGSTYLFFAYRKGQIRSAVKRQIREGAPENDLVLLRIPRSLEENPDRSFKRFHAGEFRYKGIMYDIVRQELRGDTTWYWCILDWDDTELHNQLEQNGNQQPSNDPAQRESSERLHRFWQSIFWEGIAKLNIFSTAGLPEPPSAGSALLLPGFYAVAQPPPEK